MSFNLILSNPPYGKSSSLSKKIVNTLLENKVAEEYVVLAPPSSFEVFYMKSFRDCGTTEDWFDTTAGSGVRIALAKLSIEKVNKYKSLEDVLLSDKQKQLLKTLRVYNATHKACFRGDYPIIKKSNYSKFSSIEENRIFLVPIQTAQQANCQVLRYGECFPHNFNNEPIVWKEKGAGVGSFVFDTFEQKKNFAKWWYTYSKESNRMSMLRSALYKISYTLNGDAGSRVLAELTPNLDWSKPHTDQEILAEIGLPEDFLENE